MKTNFDFEPIQPLDGYIQLAPLGVFPHVRGLQNVDKAAVESIVTHFKSFLGRLGRRFAGLPFYVGHPDAAGYGHVYTDRKAYGWIMDLEAREDGLYGRTKWSEAGRNLIASGHYKFLSATWNAAKVGEQSGRPVFRPTQLLSVGLTNEPNLPVPPLANSADCADGGGAEETMPGAPLPFPGTPVAANPESGASPEDPIPSAAGASPKNQMPSAFGTNTKDEIPNTHLEAQGAEKSQKPTLDISTEAEARIAQLEASLENCRTQLAGLQEQLITTILDNAVASTRILPIERYLWENELRTRFAQASATLANARPQLNLAARSDHLPHRNAAPGLPARSGILPLVNQKMKSTGLDYDQAWAEVRTEHPELFNRPE